MRSPIRSALLRYGAALIVTAGALSLKLLLVPLVTRDEPVLIFFAAVIVSAALGGLGPGLFATALSAVFDAYFFMQPFNRMQLQSPDQWLRLIIFTGEGVFISLICARMKSALLLAERNADEAHELEGQLLKISEEEQRRIGHDLHDGLSQHLTGIGLLSRRLEEVLADARAPGADDASRLCDLARTAVTLTRDLCRSLSPTVLGSSGLAEALRGLAAQSETMFRISCSFDSSAPTSPTPPLLDATTCTHLYRIAQEAINNAVRHGRAQHVWLRLEQHENGAFALRIEDDGAGIGDISPESSTGLGLRIMRYRARMMGASFDIHPRDDCGGTIIAVASNREIAQSKPASNPASLTETTWRAPKTTTAMPDRESLSSRTTPSSAKG